MPACKSSSLAASPREAFRRRVPCPRSTEMVPFVTLASARDPADLRRLVTPGETPRVDARSGHGAILLVGGSLEDVRPTSHPVTDQETAYQKIEHVRRWVGQVAELEGERLVAARRMIQAAGRHGKDVQQRRIATVPSLSRDTMRPPVDDPRRSAACRPDHSRWRRKGAILRMTRGWPRKR